MVNLRQIFILLLLASISVACNTRKFLKPGDEILVKNKISFIDPDNQIRDRGALKYELQTQFRQRPNDKTLGLFKPRLWFYYKQEEKGGSSDFDKFVQQKLMEPPSLYEPEQTEETRKAMWQLLFNRGYLEPEVWFEDTIINQRVSVQYFVKPNRLYTVESFEIETLDTFIQSIVDETVDQTYLYPGQPVSNALLTLEKQRIMAELYKEGYANFSFGNFSPLEATDTTDATVQMRLRIIPGQEGRFERKYVGHININNQVPREDPTSITLVSSEVHDSIRFVGFDGPNRIDPEVLLENIKFRPGQLLKKDDLAATRAQLQLPAVQFADIRSIARSDSSNIVDFEIDIIPNKRIETNVEFEINRTTVSSQSFIGLGSNLSLVNNNFLGGSERFSNNLDLSFEVNPRVEDFFNAANLNFDNTIEFPRFTEYFGIYKTLNKVGLLSDEKLDILRENANSVLDVGYEYVDLFRFFNYHSITAEFGYRKSNNTLGSRKRLQVVHPSLTYFNPTIKEQFDSLYSEQTFARKSFAPQLFTSIFFNRLNYSIEKVAGSTGISSAFISSFEISGAEVYLASLVANRLDNPFKIGDLSFAQFAKLEFDGRLYKQFGPDQVLAMRGGFGIAVPFGSTDFIPYVKQFYLGGPLNMRAWRIRELGPGGHQDETVTRRSRNPFFQAGDIKLIVNMEYRFDVFWRIEGAFFVDAGNIWTIRKDERDGGQFTSRFYRQIAVGTGAGMRFDADYFKVVLDVGLKVRNPYPDENGSYIVLGKGLPNRDLINWNFAINYPF